MKPPRKVAPVSDRPALAKAKKGRSQTGPTAARDVLLSNRHPKLKVPKAAVARAIALLDEHAGQFLGGCPAGELSLVFLTDPALAKIHADFMDDPTATDVITFEGDPVAGLAGEVCVSADTAWKYVEGRAPARPRSGGSPTLQHSFATELTLYIVHGWLHLAGYDDLVPAKKRLMRAAEARAMKLLAAADAIPTFQLKR